MNKTLNKIKNYFFIKRYPFYRKTNSWTGEEIGGYDRTWYDSIPEGWRKAFGKELSRNLRKVLKLTGELNTFKFTEIKEKWGSLRLYTNQISDAVQEVLSYYERLSIGYCMYCGKSARYCTEPCVAYVCEDCFEKMVGQWCDTAAELEDYRHKFRLTKQDIPHIYRYYKDDNGDYVEYEVPSGVDYETLWDLPYEEELDDNHHIVCD